MGNNSGISVEVRLYGELDLLTAPVVRDELVAIANAATSDEFVLDLSEVTFMDSAGLKPISEAQAVLRGRNKNLRLQGVTRSVAHLIRAAGLAQSLNVHDLTNDSSAASTPAVVLPVQRVRSQSN